MADLLERLESFRRLEPGWDSYGAVPIDGRAIDTATRFLRYLTVVPCGDGGVQIEAHGGGADMEITVNPDGTWEGWWFEVRGG